MKHFITTVFRSLEPSYVVRQYVFGGILVGLLLFGSGGNIAPYLWRFSFISLILYPFAMFVYDSLVGLFMGETVFFANWFLVLIYSIAKIIFVFSFSIVIAPFGILYLYIRNRNR